MSIRCTLGGHDLIRVDAMQYRCIVCSDTFIGETAAHKAGMPSTVAVAGVAIAAGVLCAGIAAGWAILLFGPLWDLIN